MIVNLPRPRYKIKNLDTRTYHHHHHYIEPRHKWPRVMIIIIIKLMTLKEMTLELMTLPNDSIYMYKLLLYHYHY